MVTMAMRMRDAHIWLFTILAIFLAAPALANDPIRPISPPGPVYAGQSVIFRINTQGMIPPTSATLFYRRIGTGEFQALAMNRDTEIEHSLIMEGRHNLPPGIEYFFVVEDGQRRLFTHPPQDPRANPLRLEVRLDHPAGESLLFPAMDKVRISGRRL